METNKEVVRKEKNLYIDGYNIFYKNFQTHTAKDNNAEPIGGFIGSINYIQKVVNKFSPTKVYIVFDGINAGQRRRNLLPTYKDKRGKRSRTTAVQFSEDHKVYVNNEQTQISMLFDVLKKLPLTIITIPYYEADDIIGYMVSKSANDSNTTSIIVSSDKDYLQLVNDTTFVFSPAKEILYNREKVKEKFGVPVENVTFLRAVEGDGSDNLKGVKGLKSTSLFELVPQIQETPFKDLTEFILEVEKLEGKSKKLNTLKESRQDLILMYKLMTLEISSISTAAYNFLNQQLEDQKSKQVSKIGFKLYAGKTKLLNYIKDYELWVRPFLFLNKHNN